MHHLQTAGLVWYLALAKIINKLFKDRNIGKIVQKIGKYGQN